MKNEIKLEKMHVAMLSGGKDSLYMFAHIMANIDKYPLDAVAHIKMPYDYPNLYNWYMELAEETDDYISNKKGKPFSVWGSAKYNTQYRRKRIEQMELKELERW